MGVVTPQTKGKADGAAVAAEVRRQLSPQLKLVERRQVWRSDLSIATS